MAETPHEVSIALHGPLVVEVDGEPAAIPEGHQRRLLAALAINRPRTVSTDRLIDLLWAEAAPPSARNSLQSQLARLRHHLGGPDTIQRAPPGYRLTVPAVTVDVVRFEHLVVEASRVADPAERRQQLDQALELWRTDDPAVLEANGLVEDAARLLRRRLLTQVDRGVAALETGEVALAETDARSVLSIDPLHEPGVVLLVRTLAATGRLAEADSAVQAFRDRLVTELGLDPSAALEEVHTALLRGQLPSVVGPADPPSGRSERRARPAPPRSSLHGRQNEIERTRRDLATHRCVTLLGPGGVGKTRLALEVARREEGDVVWADLLDARNRPDVLGRLALAVGCGTPTDMVTLSPLAEALGATGPLVVLDNCEQAVAQVADVADALLEVTRGTTILSTSRIPLGIDGEHISNVEPLPTRSSGDDPAAALTLFAARVGPSLDLDDPEQRRTATDVVVALDGLPLAIELAARQTRNLGLEAVRDRLDDRLALLEAARPVPHPAHSDLRSLVAWSTAQLGDADRRAFGWLSVFAGPFTVAQAEGLLGPAGAAIPGAAASLGRLVEHSLVARRKPGRFLLLETLRACAAEELEEVGDSAAAEARHTDVVLAMAEATAASFGTPGEIERITELNACLADLQRVTDRVVDRGDVGALARLACGVSEYAFETQRPELLRSARAAQGLIGNGRESSVPDTLSDGVTVAAAIEASTRGAFGEAHRLVQPLLARREATPVSAAGWNVLGNIRLWGVDDGAEAAYLEAFRVGEEAGDGYQATAGLVGVALSRAYVGDFAAARRAAADVSRRAQQLGSPLLDAWAAYARAEAEAGHNPEAALAAFEVAIERGHAVGGHLVIVAASSGATALRARHGDPATVLHHARETLEALRGSGSVSVQESTLRNVAVLLTRMGSDEVAALLLGATSSVALYEAERRRVAVATTALAERLGLRVAQRLREEGAQREPAELVTAALVAVEALISR